MEDLPVKSQSEALPIYFEVRLRDLDELGMKTQL